MKKNKYSALPLFDKLANKVLIYYQTVWAEKKFNAQHYKTWLSNFLETDVPYNERLNSMYLLSKFMFFGQDELRELLLSIFRDKYKYRIVENIRKANKDTTDISFINLEFAKELNQTRFVGLGDASESGSYLLYHFRQVTGLGTSSMKTESQLLADNKLKEPDIKNYVFIDDFCGSGETAIKANNLITKLKKLNPDIRISYYVLFSTEVGIGRCIKLSLFDNVDTVFKLDKSFKCFEDDSRYFTEGYRGIDKTFTKYFSEKYGLPITVGTPVEGHPLGFDGGQLLIGFSHNTPDNTLPIFWSDINWKPFFLRYICKLPRNSTIED